MDNIYLFLGNEPLIIQNKIDNIINLSQCNMYNITKYDCEEVNISKAIEDAMTMPFLGSRKVIIVKRPLFLTSEQSLIDHNLKMFVDYLKKPTPTTILIIDASNLLLDNRQEVVRVLLKNANVSETKELTIVEAEGWLKRQFALNGYTITSEAIKEFFNRNGLNLMRAKNEVDKLINYLKDEKIVTIEDIKTVVAKEIETEIFALTNAIIKQEKEQIILIYQDLTKAGKDALQLMGLLSRNICDLLLVSHLIDKGFPQSEIARRLNISSGRAYYLMRDSKVFSIPILEKYVESLATLDYKIKTGQIDATSGLELFLFSL